MSAALALVLLSAWIEATGLGLLAIVFRGRLPGRAWPETLGLGYMAGLGAVCWLAFLWMFAGLRFHWAGLAALTLLFIGGGGLLAWRAERRSANLTVETYPAAPHPPGALSRAAFWSLVLVCAIAIVYQTALLMHMPLFGWDSLHLWAYKTKIIAHHGAVWTEEYTSAAVTNTPRTYPHFLPVAQMLHSWATGPLIEGGAWKLFFGLLQAAFVAVFYGMARRRLGSLAALAITTLAATMPHFTNLEDGGPVSGYADVMLAVYYFLAAGAVWRWLEEGDRRWLAVGALATGFCYFTKREGVLAVMLNTGAVLLMSGGWSWREAWRRKIAPALTFIGLAALLILPVWAFARAVEVEPDLVGAMLRSLTWERFVERLDRLWFAIGTSARYLFLNPHTWALTWWGVVALAILQPRFALKPGAFYLLMAAAAPIVNFCIVAVVTTFDLQGLLMVTFPRTVQSAIGPAFLFIAVMITPWLQSIGGSAAGDP